MSKANAELAVCPKCLTFPSLGNTAIRSRLLPNGPDISIEYVIEYADSLQDIVVIGKVVNPTTGNRPVTVSCDILCRDDSLQASSIAHVTRRRHSHVPPGRTR
ncbi:hypothetical protein EVAR_10472_1 [Eumeta japonica]|uniref:Uncharacterized protein n=1 Tax=Eumeta variegata TaxID=151549 RepID=A0A4C1THB9_EUMVA|nr:hypothetical protein EVAR_10472_1 [Eumeta japonica]